MSSNVEILGSPSAVVLRTRGRLVFGDGAGLLRALALRVVAGGQDVALDLARVSQIDAHGVGTLAELCAAARRSKRQVLLTDASDRVRRVLRITHLDTFMPEVEDAAIHAARAAAPTSTADVH